MMILMLIEDLPWVHLGPVVAHSDCHHGHSMGELGVIGLAVGVAGIAGWQTLDLQQFRQQTLGVHRAPP